ncbi:MAG: hypothetical protein Q8O56_13735 [Solirubrobacteraceae bacterium]|nr:hypothetical protein [Solirubrobacteraceae bacterium]
MPSTPPTYRERLRLEGAVLAAAGGLASVLLLALVAEASERAASTAIQIVFVAVVLAVAGPIFVRRWLGEAQPVTTSGGQLTGQPTALWKPPLVVVVLTALFVAPGELGIGAVGWDAGLRITLGCLLVGLAQALLIERVVAADEARNGRSYVRLPGSRATSGTKLGFFPNERA